MGTFELVRDVAAPPEVTFAVVGDLTAYGDFVAMTSVRGADLPIGAGWTFTARTGVGSLRLPDRMRVSLWEPPHRFRVSKLGPVLDGWADVQLDPHGAGTRVRWWEEITVRPRRIGALLGPALDPVNRWLFSRALRRMAARAERAGRAAQA